MVDLNGHEAGNGRHSQGKPTAHRDSSTRREAILRQLAGSGAALDLATVSFGSCCDLPSQLRDCLSITVLIGGIMATRPLRPPEHDPARTNTGPTRTPERTRGQPVSSMPAPREQLHALMQKRWLRVVGVAVAAFLLLLVVLPFLINVNSFRPKIESEATNALGRQVKLGDLSLSILTGTVGVSDISIADDPAFSKSPFITAKSLKVGVELMPLIFSKQLKVTGIALNQPQITLLNAANGTWNFASLGAIG